MVISSLLIQMQHDERDQLLSGGRKFPTGTVHTHTQTHTNTHDSFIGFLVHRIISHKLHLVLSEK